MLKKIVPIFIILAITVFLLYLLLFKKEQVCTKPIAFTEIKSYWVDSLVKNMSIEQKIGNLLIFDVGKINSGKLDAIKHIIGKYHIGGIVYETDSIQSYINMLDTFQSCMNIPLFICSKNKTAYPGNFNDIIKFPGKDALKSITGKELMQEYAHTVVSVNSVLRTNICFVPQFLINNKKNISLFNDKNIIASFCNSEIYNAKNDSGIFRNITKTFSTLTENVIPSVFLKKDIKLDTSNHTNLFLSNYLTEKLDYKGLIISNDVSDIENISLSSTDIVLAKNNIPAVIENIKRQIVQNKLSIDNLNKKVRKILLAKSWAGLENYKTIKPVSAKQKINTIYNTGLSRKLYGASITIVKNEAGYIPVTNTNTGFFIYNFNNDNNNFSNILKYYVKYDNKTLGFDSAYIQKMIFYPEYSNYIIVLNNITIDTFALDYLNKAVKWQKNKSNIIIVNFNNPSVPKYLSDCPVIIQCYGNSKTEEELAAQAIFGGIAVKGKFPEEYRTAQYKYTETKKTRIGYTVPEEFGLSSMIMSNIDTVISDALRQHAFPGCQVFIAKEGKVIFSKSYGYHTYNNRIKVKWDDIYDIASITKVAGTTLAVMKMTDQGKIDLDKKIEEYFKNTEIEYTKIKPDTIINIDTINIYKFKNLDKFIENKDTLHISDSVIVVYDTLFFRVTPKVNIFKRTVGEMLQHKSGLPPSMPILRYLLYKEDTNIVLPDTFIVDKDSSVVFDSLPSRKDTLSYLFNKYFTTKFLRDTSEIQIAKNMFLRKDYQDTLWIDTKQIRVYSKSAFMYSDVNAIMVQQVIDTINDCGIDKYLSKHFYKPMGLRTIGFLPLENFHRQRIIPTEDDKYWRQQLVHGYVHDPSAALIGGVAGNAGLFSNAHDLGIIFQMLLDGGKYGGKQYLYKETINKFTDFQPDTYRGLGFDKALEKNIIAYDAPPESFGHTGFTGCCVWADPKEKLVFVFLSNRIYPSVKNWKINSLEIRQRVHQIVYDAIVAKKPKFKQ